MAKSLNKVMLIGNLTKDPELRYTPTGAAVCTFSVAVNRQWKTESGETKEDAEFVRIVAWNKLAEICAQLLKKGRKTYVEGRLQTRSWTGQDGNQRYTTEVVASDVIILDRKGEVSGEDFSDIVDVPVEEKAEKVSKEEPEKTEKKGKDKEEKEKPKDKTKEDEKELEGLQEDEEDIPF